MLILNCCGFILVFFLLVALSSTVSCMIGVCEWWGWSESKILQVGFRSSDCLAKGAKIWINLVEIKIVRVQIIELELWCCDLNRLNKQVKFVLIKK